MNEAKLKACGLDDKTQRAIDIIEGNTPASESYGMDEYQHAAWTLCDKVREISAKLRQAGDQQPEAEPNAEAIASSVERVVSLLEIGSETQWGKVAAVGNTAGERYYWMVDKHGCVDMMPASVVEAKEKQANDQAQRPPTDGVRIR